MSDNNKPRCAGMLWQNYRYINCTNTGKHEHDGKLWCGTHHPPTIEAKRAARDEEYREAEARKLAARKAAEHAHRRSIIEGMTDDELSAECSRRGWEVTR